MSRKRNSAGGGAAILMTRRRRRWHPGVSMMFIALTATMTMGVAPALIQSTASARPISDCPDVHVVAVPGTLDSSVVRDPHDQNGVLAPMIADAQRDAPPGSMQTTYVPYPADFGYTSGGTPYSQSVDAGVAATEAQIAQINRQCGSDTDIAIVGYSQGADIANRVAADIGSGEGPVPASRVRGVYLISDPSREMDAELVPGAPGLSAPLNGARTGVAESDAALGGGIGAGNTSQFGALTGRVVSLCMTGDFACAIPENAQAVRIGANVAEQIHIDTTDPELIATDLGTVVARSGAMTALHVTTTPHWMLSSETLGDVIETTSDPYYTVPDYTDPAVVLQSVYGVATFALEFPNAWEAKVQQELVLGIRNNLGVVVMAAHPEYWYPGLSHTSYFSQRDQAGRTGTNYVSSWLRESATSDIQSGSVESVSAPAAEEPPVSDAVANSVTTGVAVAEVGGTVARQMPTVVDALTDEAGNVARGTEYETEVADVTGVIDQGAAAVENVFVGIEQVVAEVQPIVDIVENIAATVGRPANEPVQPAIEPVQPIVDPVQPILDTVENIAATVGQIIDAGQPGPGGVPPAGDAVPQIGSDAVTS